MRCGGWCTQKPVLLAKPCTGNPNSAGKAVLRRLEKFLPPVGNSWPKGHWDPVTWGQLTESLCSSMPLVSTMILNDFHWCSMISIGFHWFSCEEACPNILLNMNALFAKYVTIHGVSSSAWDVEAGAHRSRCCWQSLARGILILLVKPFWGGWRSSYHL